MVDFSIVLLKIIPPSCVHRFYIQNHDPSALFCESENLVRFRGYKLLVDLVTITRFTYISKNNNLLYLIKHSWKQTRHFNR